MHKEIKLLVEEGQGKPYLDSQLAHVIQRPSQAVFKKLEVNEEHAPPQVVWVDQVGEIIVRFCMRDVMLHCAFHIRQEERRAAWLQAALSEAAKMLPDAKAISRQASITRCPRLKPAVPAFHATAGVASSLAANVNSVCFKIATVSTSRTFEEYDSAIYQLNALTPHQEKCDEIRACSSPRGKGGDGKDVHRPGFRDGGAT